MRTSVSNRLSQDGLQCQEAKSAKKRGASEMKSTAPFQQVDKDALAAGTIQNFAPALQVTS
jgi:hypothetical protein